jgi:mRNA interferase RelE/StbE
MPMTPDMSDSSTYQVILRPAAQRALRHADRPVQHRLLDAMTDLGTHPRPHGTKALQGHRGLLRIPVGNYRIVYEVLDSELVVTVITLGHRSQVYDRI